MYPHERSLVKQLANMPFAIIGVNSDPDLEKAKTAVKENDLTWRSFWNGPEGPRGSIAEQWNVWSWPTVHILDSEGRIRFKNVHGKKIDEAIETLLLEMGHDINISR